MSACYICNHEITALCARCGSKLTIRDERGTELPHGTEIQVEPCDCEPKKETREL